MRLTTIVVILINRISPRTKQKLVGGMHSAFASTATSVATATKAFAGHMYLRVGLKPTRSELKGFRIKHPIKHPTKMIVGMIQTRMSQKRVSQNNKALTKTKTRAKYASSTNKMVRAPRAINADTPMQQHMRST